MANINLLPWREELRERLNKVFALSMVFVVLVAGIFVFLVDSGLSMIDTFYRSRLSTLESEIKQIDSRVKEINSLKTARNELIKKIDIVASLQGNRGIITYIFEEMLLILPDEVYFTSFMISDKNISINAVAENSKYITQIMNNIKNSKLFFNPVVTTITKNHKDNSSWLTFDISMEIKQDKEVAK